MGAALTQIRRQLASLAAKKGCRVTAFSTACPTEWCPGKVIDPEIGMGFSDSAAWALIVSCLQDDSIELVEIELRKPPGKKGYVMRISLSEAQPMLYVKLQLGGPGVIGRSFHNDEPPEK